MTEQPHTPKPEDIFMKGQLAIDFRATIETLLEDGESPQDDIDTSGGPVTAMSLITNYFILRMRYGLRQTHSTKTSIGI